MVDGCEPIQGFRNRRRRSFAGGGGGEACRSAALPSTCPDLPAFTPSRHLHHASLLQLYRPSSSHDHFTSTFCAFTIVNASPAAPVFPPAPVVCNKRSAVSNNSQTIALCTCTKASTAKCGLVAQGLKWLEASRDDKWSACMKQLEKDAGQYNLSVQILSRVTIPNVGNHDERLVHA